MTDRRIETRLNDIIDALDGVSAEVYWLDVRMRRVAGRVAYLGESYNRFAADQERYSLPPDDSFRFRPDAEMWDDLDLAA